MCLVGLAEGVLVVVAHTEGAVAGVFLPAALCLVGAGEQAGVSMLGPAHRLVVERLSEVAEQDAGRQGHRLGVEAFEEAAGLVVLRIINFSCPYPHGD